MFSNKLSSVCTILSMPWTPSLRQPLLEALNAVCDDVEVPEEFAPLILAVRNPRLAEDQELFDRLINVFCRVFGAKSSTIGLLGVNGLTAFTECVKLVSQTVVDSTVVCTLRFVRKLCEHGCQRELFDIVPSMTKFLKCSSAVVQEEACACVQLLCTGTLTIESFVCADGCVMLGALLHSSVTRVVLGATRAIHSLSQDINFAKEVCDCGLVPALSLLVRLHSDVNVVASAAGTLQNVGREKSSTALLSKAKVVESVAPLLLSSDCSLQAAGLGVILNLHIGTAESKAALISVLRWTLLSESLSDCTLL